MGVSGKEQIFILIDTFFYILNHGCQVLSSLVVVNAKSIHGFTTSCQDKCKLHFPSKEFKGIIYPWFVWEDVCSQSHMDPAAKISSA